MERSTVISMKSARILAMLRSGQAIAFDPLSANRVRVTWERSYDARIEAQSDAPEFHKGDAMAIRRAMYPVKGMRREKVAYTYHVVHRSVDGAGTTGTYATFAEAKAAASAAYARSEARGNPWQYSYHVYGPGGRKMASFPSGLYRRKGRTADRAARRRGMR